jgi:hypothetical protein
MVEAMSKELKKRLIIAIAWLAALAVWITICATRS